MAKTRTINKTTNTGKAFELAVARIVQTLDPHAKVTSNFKGRDRDTGERQQMDVWIDATLMGHFPVTVLISCKDYNRVLHAGDIRVFLSELRDSSASTGVIYASHGFNEHALKKAKANGVNCCRLYQNQPSDLPESIGIRSYLCRSSPTLPVSQLPPGNSRFAELSWDTFLEDTVIHEGREIPILDWIADSYYVGEQWAISNVPDGKLLPGLWSSNLQATFEKSTLLLTIGGRWRYFRGRQEATLLDGSYCLTGKSFLGTQMMPYVAVREENPGPGWEEITENPIRVESATVCTVQTFGKNIRDALSQTLRGKALSDPI